ncbi:MAG: hypothetical protein WB626_01305 [Bacteroidota bacterium]
MFLACALLLQGCAESLPDTVDPRGNPPVLSGMRVSPASVNIDSLPGTGGPASVSVIVQVRAEDPEGGEDIASVTAELRRPGAQDPFLEAVLRDDGSVPDSAAGDGWYAAEMEFTASRPQAGVHPLRCLARDRRGLRSVALEMPFRILRMNTPPGLAGLSAPDTVLLPAGDSLLIPMNVAAADSDGLGDVREVFFRSLDSSDPLLRFSLLDDGGASPLSGDLLAGDGIFSTVVLLVDAPGVRRSFRFAFQAEDTFGDTSSTLLHTLTVR